MEIGDVPVAWGNAQNKIGVRLKMTGRRFACVCPVCVSSPPNPSVWSEKHNHN